MTAKKELNTSILRAAIHRRVAPLAELTGELRLPCAPSMTDHHVATLSAVFRMYGRGLTDKETAAFRSALEKTMEEGFSNARAPSRVVVKWSTAQAGGASVRYEIELEPNAPVRTPRVLDEHPDARVLRLAAELGAPGDIAVLDASAGSTRNARGLESEGFSVEIFKGDFLGEARSSSKTKYKLVIVPDAATRVPRKELLRRLGERAAPALLLKGRLLFSLFTAVDGYKPDALARELSVVTGCPVHTRADLAVAFEGLPLKLAEDVAAYDYEHDHVPHEAWPPAEWFAAWAQGGDLFDLPLGRAPVELRWFTFERR